ncbi:MAG: inosine/xanthosine triphosphatase [Gemmatimonadaceae bacterium]|nr:inosine/xanthosine triphosphatase [Gemmatimonadaceae bacterium]
MISDIARVAVGSANPVKVAATQAVLAWAAPGASAEARPVPSGVPDQPFGDEQTIAGARERARRAREAADADLGVGLEGGVVDGRGGMRTCAWCVVVHRDGREGVGGSLAMPLPDAVARMIREGEELGHAMDRLVAERGTKHGKGAVGILTAGRIDRQAAYEVLVTYALAPFVTPALYAR